TDEKEEILLSNVSCQEHSSWRQQADNQWVSAFGLLLALYPEDSRENSSPSVVSASFWNSDAVSEASSVLQGVSPGQEVDVTGFFWRVGDPWRVSEIPQDCPPDADCMPSPYVIYYLHSPDSDWVIDRLLTRAQGAVVSQPDPQDPANRDIYVATDGPYLPIFEGRYQAGDRTVWFSASKAEDAQTLSTSESRFAALQAINDFLQRCESGK
ncbi:MAG: hypothetical protein AAFN12_12965, partial [Cyanobacteria bacterium J06560_2]